MTTSLYEEWLDFKESYENGHSLTSDEALGLRIAFYAGANALMNIHDDLNDSGDAEVEEAIDGVIAELDSFHEQCMGTMG